MTPSSDHERAWAEALATEHLHQRELLATFRGELGTFARECAQAVATLDVFLGSVAGVAQVVSAAGSAHEHAAIVRDVARRLSGLRHDAHEDVAEVYAALEHEGDLAASVVQRARDALTRAPKRADRELLKAIVATQGVRQGIEQIIGPAPLAALTALAPLARLVQRFSTAKDGRPDRRELVDSARDSLLGVLQAETQVDGGVALAETSDSAALAASLHEAVQHVRGAARAVEEGRIEQVITEARRLLETDLEALQGVIDASAEAPGAWLGERRKELAELREEVREKLERIEHTRRLLAGLLPHIQTAARALAVAGRVKAVEGQFDPQAAAVTAEAAQLLLLVDLGALWDASLPDPAHETPRARVTPRRIAVAVVLLLAVAAGVAIALSGGSSGTKPKLAVSTVSAAPSTTAIPAAPSVSPVHADFKPLERATYYAVSATAAGQGTPTYTWSLSPPKGNASCNRFGPVPGKPNEAVWRHADGDGCNHALMGVDGHPGTVTVIVKTTAWECTATFFGTITRSGPPAKRCHRV